MDGHGRLNGGQQVVAGVVVQGVDHLHRVRAAGDIEHGAVTEVGGELLAVQRRRCDDQPQPLGTAGTDPAK